MFSWTLGALCFCSIILPLSSQEIYNNIVAFKHVKIDCKGYKHHESALKSSLLSLGEANFTSSINSNVACNKKLPTCLVSFQLSKILLEGSEEISKQTLQNAVTLLQSGFLLDVDAIESASGYLKMFSTMYQSHDYVRAATNLCRALKKESQFKCYFVDVISDPSILVTYHRSIPFIEVKTSDLLHPLIITDPHPNLWKFHKQAGIAEDEESKFDGSSDLAQCLDQDCSINLAIDELLYNHDYWKKEILPHKPVKIAYLGDTGISEAPAEVLQVLDKGKDHVPSSEIVFVIYTLHPDDCSSCKNALPELKLLKEQMRTDKSRIYYVNCDKQHEFCSRQKVTGFPTFLAYKIPKQPDSALCSKKDIEISVVNYHGLYKAVELIQWYKDVNDMGIHFGQPHDFHEGCYVHITITASEQSSDGLPIDCMVGVCKLLSFSECFILQNNKNDIYVKSVELKRRDGVASVIYEDNISLSVSFSRTQDLHRYHGDHHYDLPNCADNLAECTDMLHTFISEHSRVPLTELSPVIFHSPASYQPLFGNLPVLVALVEHDTVISKSPFMEVLERVSVQFYKNIVTSFVDVDRYPTWVHGMSPASTEPFLEDSWVFKYPRVLVFHLNDHKKAQFLRVVGKELSEKKIVGFIKDFLKNPKMESCNGI